MPLKRAMFPWSSETSYSVIVRDAFTNHMADLARQTPAQALRAASALPSTIGGLLDALIGARLAGVFMKLALAGDSWLFARQDPEFRQRIIEP